MQVIRYDASGPSVQSDPWVYVDDETQIAAEADVVVSWDRWLAEKVALLNRPGQTAVCVDGHAVVAEVVEELSALPLILINFPKFTDGRGYSLARLLRTRFKYAGELRAVGHILRDQLSYLYRCGFTSFALHPSKDPHDALDAFQDFSAHYQPGIGQAQPRWRVHLKGHSAAE